MLHRRGFVGECQALGAAFLGKVVDRCLASRWKMLPYLLTPGQDRGFRCFPGGGCPPVCHGGLVGCTGGILLLITLARDDASSSSVDRVPYTQQFPFSDGSAFIFLGCVRLQNFYG